MSEHVELSFLEKYAWIEAYLRRFFERYPTIKKSIKKYRNNTTHVSVTLDEKTINPHYWNKYQEVINEHIRDKDIILIHSSLDGLARIGVTSGECMKFLKSLVKERKCTIVMPCFPVTNLRISTEKSKPYDPKKTLCWTGMLPNVFIADPDCIRTSYPYNSLAAIGPNAEEMMKHNLKSKLVYGNNTAWRYCFDHHAKILFCGVKASKANTMAIHMLPDYMGEDWPISDWYEEVEYNVKINDDRLLNVCVKKQRSVWYKYVMEEGTSGYLKKIGILKEYSIHDCNLGIINDCNTMLTYLASEAKKKNLLTYLIPKRYYKH